MGVGETWGRGRGLEYERLGWGSPGLPCPLWTWADPGSVPLLFGAKIFTRTPFSWRPLAGPLSLHLLRSSCTHGKLSCSMGDCDKAGGGFGPWGPWGLCSRSCGGLGTRTRSRQCVRPAPAPGGQSCHGPRQDLEYCPSPDCPGEGRAKEGQSPAGPSHFSWPFVPSCLWPSLRPALGLSSSHRLVLCFFSAQAHSPKFLVLLPNAPKCPCVGGWGSEDPDLGTQGPR